MLISAMKKPSITIFTGCINRQIAGRAANNRRPARVNKSRWLGNIATYWLMTFKARGLQHPRFLQLPSPGCFQACQLGTVPPECCPFNHKHVPTASLSPNIWFGEFLTRLANHENQTFHGALGCF
jgi:hypothetical protein